MLIYIYIYIFKGRVIDYTITYSKSNAIYIIDDSMKKACICVSIYVNLRESREALLDTVFQP